MGRRMDWSKAKKQSLPSAYIKSEKQKEKDRKKLEEWVQRMRNRAEGKPSTKQQRKPEDKPERMHGNPERGAKKYRRNWY